MEMTIIEIANCLNLPDQKVERWISQGHIPIRRNGGICIFNESVLGKWAETHHLTFQLPDKKFGQDARTGQPASPNTQSLLPAMMHGGVYHDVDGGDIYSVLQTAVGLLKNIPEVSKTNLYESLVERENLMSTGIGKGIAFPHPRTPLADIGDEKILATFFLRNAVEFHAIDGKPVKVLFMLLFPTTREHLNLLSRLAFCVRNDAFASYLKTAPDADGLYSKITELERLLG
jgi:nitrogen PTS system EIIA component